MSKFRFLIASLGICVAPAVVNARTITQTPMERVGDLLQVIVPAYAFGMAMNEDGYMGAKQFAYSFAAMEMTVYGLKYTVDEERPNKADHHSFPSGHTASAFSGASFIHRRYGIKRAIVPYLLAGFTGYTRIDANKHHWWDVLAGAAISTAFSFAIVDKYSNVSVSAGPTRVGVNVKF